MIKHTPGPWHVIQHGTMVVSDPNGDIEKTHIASIVGHNGDANFNANGLEANAKLIAAAPDLLEALQRLQTAAYNVGGEHVTEHQQLIDAADSAQAAIAKATQ